MAGALVIGVAVVLRAFAFAFMGIIGNVVAGCRLAGVILRHGDWK